MDDMIEADGGEHPPAFPFHLRRQRPHGRERKPADLRHTWPLRHCRESEIACDAVVRESDCYTPPPGAQAQTHGASRVGCVFREETYFLLLPFLPCPEDIFAICWSTCLQKRGECTQWYSQANRYAIGRGSITHDSAHEELPHFLILTSPSEESIRQALDAAWCFDVQSPR